eukprot:2991-Heterococcus_DN1.PRE.2
MLYTSKYVDIWMLKCGSNVRSIQQQIGSRYTHWTVADVLDGSLCDRPLVAMYCAYCLLTTCDTEMIVRYTTSTYPPLLYVGLVRASGSVLALLATCDRGSLLLTELLGTVAALTVREAAPKSLSSHL